MINANSHEIQEIPVDELIYKASRDGEAACSEKLLGRLARSIRADGLISFPVVRRSDEMDKWEVVTGHHRVLVMDKYLHMASIPCRVYHSLTDRQADQMNRAENVCRIPLSQAQRLKMLREWRAEYAESHPRSVGSGSHKKGGKHPADAAPSFTEVAADGLNCSRRTIERDCQVAKLLNEDEIEILEAANATQAHIRAIANLKVREVITAVIEQIKAGVKIEDAIRTGKQLKARHQTEAREGEEISQESSQSSRKRGRPGAKALAVQTDEESDLTDEEWVANRCTPMHDSLLRKDVYEYDCSLYRKIMNARGRFKKAVQNILIEHKKRIPQGTPDGPLYELSHRLANLDHPCHWVTCTACSGNGVDEVNGGDCAKCNGKGYWVQTEP